MMRILSPLAEVKNPLRVKELRNSRRDPTAPRQRTASNSPGLAAVVDAWPTLPEAIKAGILSMIKAAVR
jgi:hypothetical protein